MTKVKYNVDTGLYKLKLTHAQLELMAKYCANTVLGPSEEYRTAAKDFLVMLEKGLGSGFIEAACDVICLDAVIQSDDPIGGEDIAIIKNDNLALRVRTHDYYNE